ncbi:MAG: DDE-type integrase/transposase/recombinase [Selenomonas sp.]|nr:DDE-type integrase/transposase/recombinase [Selenomonas sp.]
MTSIPHSNRYLPHEVSTRFYAVKLYRSGVGVKFVCRRYHISKASLMRWNKRFDETRESLLDHSHRPHSPHPNSHTEQELKWIHDLHRRNPHISLLEMFGKLKSQKGYSRHPLSLYRVFRQLRYSSKASSTKKAYVPKPYDTPDQIGVKWQMDVKYVPTACYTGDMPQKFYQYTVIDEASRERFLYPYLEQTSFSTVDFLQRAIRYFGYQPQILQTDNGAEFTHIAKTDRTHPLDVLCQKLGINHKRIRPRTPRHNGKVERSHRSDQERFYNHLKFYSFDDLNLQMARYRRRANQIPMQSLNWLSPIQKRKQLV